VEFARSTGIAITFSPNGLYHAVWEPHARVLRPLIEAGQVQIGNHTYDHTDLTRVSDAVFREEVERNEEWIERTFATTTRPYLRPPYGARDERTDGLSGELGYTKVLMWNASFGDSRLLTPQVLLAQAQKYLRPGAIVLGHANHPTVTHLYEQILEILRERDLTPVTLDTMFGTSRTIGA
jgi:peptidoglycan/xylan/chitin deacetylase (PgdA/CDA1 family)